MRITSKGQVTIPIEVRERLGLHPLTEIEFEIHGNAARIVKARKKTAGSSRGTAVVGRLRGKATKNLTTAQIMALTRGE